MNTMDVGEIRIDKGVPMPDAWRLGRREEYGHKYPWREMGVGDSFFVPKVEPQRLRTSGRNYAFRNGLDGWQFSVASRTEGGQRGSRIWRTA